jgi:hypothetical protein
VGLRTGLNDVEKRKYRPYRHSISDTSASSPELVAIPAALSRLLERGGTCSKLLCCQILGSHSSDCDYDYRIYRHVVW